ncbi:MAG: tRNA/rRNA methyltransferase (SpoU) [uncultured bacterium]|nr:MAG: tRNA/rRNA methyltransferase (SpoU) [uncultured bacterium]HCU70428.1 RNA methyltransferase [Candidatus Moranbacteria bacterium]
MNQKKLYIIAHNIRSAHNVGAIFRTCDGAGASKIYLTGYTPEPASSEKEEKMKTKAEKMLEKTALGAENNVPWERVERIDDLMLKLKKEGFSIVALEKTKNSTPMNELHMNFPIALILGNEVDGVNEELLEKCDSIMEIPMRGKKESLNVSVAAGIGIYKILE